MGLTATLNSQLASLHLRLAASIGLTEVVASTLSQKALPIMVRTLCKADSLGSADNVWTMCQQFHEAQVHTNLTELTRPDTGWPEHRRHLAQTLLSTGRFIALTEHCAPATPDRAGQWLGCLALVTLAVAGQYAAENQLDAAGLQSWLRAQPLMLSEPSAVVALPVAAAAQPARAAAATATAPWWPLVVLAAVGIGASSYFWQQQTAATALQPPKVAATRPAPRIPAPALRNAAVVPAAEAVATAEPASTTNPVGVEPTRSPAFAKQPAVRVGQPGRLAAVPAPKPTKSTAKAALALAVGHPGAARVAPLAIRRTNMGLDNDKNSSLRESSGPMPTPALPGAAASTESLLYKRLANPESGSRKPIDLDHLSFAPGQAALDVEGTKQLSSIASVLKTFPHYRLIVFGNAEPSEPNSIGLALDRANIVIAELVKQGVPSAALQAQGHLRSAADKADDAIAKRRPALYISSLE